MYTYLPTLSLHDALPIFADLGALLARDRGQLGVVVGGEIAREADIGGLVDLPAVAGHRAAAQFERGAAQLLGKRPGRTAERPHRRVGRSEEHTSELQSLMRISYAVFCLKKKKQQTHRKHDINTQKCIQNEES